MADGLMLRYRLANQSPPVLLYVDRDCCSSAVPSTFSQWPDLTVRLDIWHFMRRFASCCTTESHQLYGLFMSRLSHCIFEWDQRDVEALCIAKANELTKLGVAGLSKADILQRLGRKEMALHCRRATRGAAETTKLIDELIAALDSDNGKDTLGVPLLDHDRIQLTWQQQRRHVGCIQDPPDVQLYTRTGTLKKGDVELPTYRCARGSTSVESFHRHLAQFIPVCMRFSPSAYTLLKHIHSLHRLI
jgi:hypothetical protein